MRGHEQPTTSSEVLPLLPSRVLRTDLEEFACGHETSQMAQALDIGVINFKKLQLQQVLALCECGVIPGRYSDLLNEAESVRADALNAILNHPAVGAWLYTAIEKLHDRARLPEDTAIIQGEVSALTAVVACQANLTFECPATLYYGELHIPTMGSLYLEPRDEAPISDVLLCSDGSGMLYIRQNEDIFALPGPSNDATWWQGEQHVFPSTSKMLLLDDLTPDFNGNMPRRLDAAKVQEWEFLLQDAWSLLEQDYPNAAHALGRRIHAIKPLNEYGRTIGAATKRELGAIALKKPKDALACSEALIHEGAHDALNRFHTLGVSLFTSDEANEMLAYAPWRDDPRPLPGLLHGCYSFMQVADFWRERVNDDGQLGALAQFQYARWSAFAHIGTEQLQRHASLTRIGKIFVDAMESRLDTLQTDAHRTVGPIAAMARAAVADHAALWRIHHLQPNQTLINEVASAWHSGGDPPPTLATTPSVLSPSKEAMNFRARATLVSNFIKEPDSLRDFDLDLPLGATEADVAYILGKPDAEKRYRTLLAQPARSLAISAFVGMGLVDLSNDHPAAEPLFKYPEVIYRLVEEEGVKPEQVRDVALWISEGGY